MKWCFFKFILLFIILNENFIFSFPSQKNNISPKTETVVFFKKIDSLRSNKIFTQEHLKFAHNLLKNEKKLTLIEELQTNNYLAYFHLIKLNLDSTEFYCDKNLKIKIKTKQEEIAIAYTYYYLSNLTLNSGLNNESIRYYEKSIAIFKKHQIKDGILRAQMTYAQVLYYLKKNEEAITIINENLKILENTPYNYLHCIQILSKIKFLKAYDPSLANKYIEKTYTLFKNKKVEPLFLIEVNAYWISLLLEKSDFQEAKKVIDETLKIANTLNETRSLDMIHWVIAEYDSSIKVPLSKKDYFYKRIKESNQANDLQTLRNLYFYLKENAFIEKNTDSLYKYAELYNHIENQMAAEETKSQILELNTRYETEKKAQIIKLNQLEIEKKNNLIFLIISLLLITIFSTIIIFLVYKRRKDKEKNNLDNFYTKKMFANIEDERKRMAMELHDNIAHELLVFKDHIEESKKNKIDFLIQELRQITRNLHPILFQDSGLKGATEQLIERLQIKSNIFFSSTIDYNKRVDLYRELQIYRIIQEALNNIIKHSHAQAAIVIIKEKNTTLKIQIKDNGLGFNYFSKLNSTKSFGLHSIIERAKILNSELHVDSSDKGTIITLEFII